MQNWLLWTTVSLRVSLSLISLIVCSDDKGAGVCGLGPKFCGEGCTSTCGYKSECDPGWGIQWSNATKCPLNVCCSEFGFCGTTPTFCKGILTPSPQCGGRSSDKRTIGYYEGWNMQRPCGSELSVSYERTEIDSSR